MLASLMRRALTALLTAAFTVSCRSTPGPAADVWLGTLSAGSANLRVQFHLDPKSGACVIDSLDQGAEGIPCAELKINGPNVSFVSTAIHARFHGTLAADGKTLTGVWNQGEDLPLLLTRRNAPSAAVASKLDAALPPVPLDKL